MLGILVHGKLRQEGCHEFEASLDYIGLDQLGLTCLKTLSQTNSSKCGIINSVHPFLSKEINKY